MRRDDQERDPYQQIQDYLTDHYLEIASGDFPKQRLDNALRALAGNTTPPPKEMVDILFPQLHGGIYEVAMASDGTVAVVGKHNGNDRDKVVLVVGSGNRGFTEVFRDKKITDLFFPENSSHPAFKAYGQNSAQAEFPNEWVWDLGDLGTEHIRLPASDDPTTHPLFWIESDQPRGAIVVHGQLFETNDIYPYEVTDTDLGLPEDEYTASTVCLIDGRLLSRWQRNAISASDLRRFWGSRLVWNGKITPELRIYPRSITVGPNGQPHYIYEEHSGGNIRLGNMDGLVTEFDHSTGWVWTAPGQIFTVEVVNPADIIQGETICIHEVISDWNSTTIEGAPSIHSVWPVDDHNKSVAVLENTGQLRYLAENMVLGGFVDLGQCETRLVGNTLTFQFDKDFSFCQHGKSIFDATDVPRQELSLNDLVLMDDGSIQGVAKIGTAVVTYKFYDPNE